jgi:hypothetical protein
MPSHRLSDPERSMRVCPKATGWQPTSSPGSNQIAMESRHLQDSGNRPASGLFIVCALVAWLPFVCLFAPFRMTVQDGDAWYVSYTSVLYLRARWVYSPAVAVFGPAWLVGAGLVQSMLVMLGLRICIHKAARLIETAPPLFTRMRTNGLEHIANSRAHLAAVDKRAAFFSDGKHVAQGG